MSDSTKFLLVALVLLTGSLLRYDLLLRAQYRVGTFRDPLADFANLSFRDFDAINIDAASLAGVDIRRGPFSIKVFKEMTEALAVSQNGHELTLALRFPKDARSYLSSGHPAVLITCPSLRVLRTNATYSINGKPVTDRIQASYNEHPIVVARFAQDSLLVLTENGSKVVIRDNVFQSLHVVAAKHAADGAPTVQLGPGNIIQAASLRMYGKSHLILQQLNIARPSYFFADSAAATLPGPALNGLLGLR